VIIKCILKNGVNINWRDVQRRNVVNNLAQTAQNTSEMVWKYVTMSYVHIKLILLTL